MKGSKSKTSELFFVDDKVVKTYPTNDIFIESAVVSEEIKKKLRSNPFTYSIGDEIAVDSIEDFLVPIKFAGQKDEVLFGVLVHSNELKKTKKQRIVRKTFRIWNKSYCQERSRNQKISQGFSVTRPSLEQYTIKTKYWIISWLLVLLYGLLAFILLYKWENHTANWLIDGLSKVSNNSLYKVIFYIGASLSFIIIVLQFVLVLTKRKYQERLLKREKIIEKSKIVFEKNYRKKFKKVKKYYMQNIRKGIIYYPAYPIDKVGFDELNFNSINDISNQITEKAAEFDKYWPKISLLFKVLTITTLLVIVCIFILMIILMIL